MNRSYDQVVIFDKVSFTYANEPVLEDVSLTVERGEFASIVGPNGGGKTTLLKLMLGLIKPDVGKITVLGNTPDKSRPRLGYMPQYAHLDMQFPVTVLDVVLIGRLGPKFGCWYSKQDIKTAMAALGEVKLSNLADSTFSQLSGGQRQRVLIARALCGNPDLLLLDEPTASIDPEVEETLFHVLQKLNRRMTILFVSHDIGFVSQIVKSVICVNRQVVVHPTSDINSLLVKEIYGSDLRMIRHDHRCSEEGHCHD